LKDKVNYEWANGTNTDIELAWVIAAANPIRNDYKKTDKYGIAIKPSSIVSAQAEIEIKLPDNESVLSAKIVIYDNVGNVVFEKSIIRDGKATWNLTNLAGRSVANGWYLAVAEVNGVNGTYAYSAKVGVSR
jgi:hypothetical protein